MDIKELLQNYDQKFKVFYPKSLFPPSPDEIRKYLKEGKCPICARKLYWRRDRKVAFCKSKVKDKFVIKRETMQKYE